MSDKPCLTKSPYYWWDDHALVRRGFRRMLDDDQTLEVVGEASNGAEAVKLAEKLHPQVVVMDCQMPELNGLEATKKILLALPQTAILMLSMHSEDTLVRQALDAGARGYVLKNANDLDLAKHQKRRRRKIGSRSATAPRPSPEGDANPRSPRANSKSCNTSLPENPTRRSPPSSSSASTPSPFHRPTSWTVSAFTNRRAGGLRHS